MEMETKEIIKTLKEYSPYNEHITLASIFAKMKIGDGSSFNVINHGPPGTGKSYSSLEFIDKLNLGTEIILDNNVTKRGLFETFLNYPEHDIILDECTALMRDKGAQDMIKLGAEGKSLNWVKKSSVETTPLYKGNIIINSNLSLMDSLSDRFFVNVTLMNRKMAVDFVDHYLDKKISPEKEFLKFIRRRIKSKDADLTENEIKYVREFVKKQIEMNDEILGYSRRVIQRMLSYFKRVKKLFGRLDDEVLLFIEPYAAAYIENRRTPTLIETLLGDEKVEKPSLIRLLSRETGYSERHARRLVDEELIKGKLKLFGRMVSIA